MMPWAREGAFPSDAGERAIAHDVDFTKQRVLICTPTRGREVGDNYRRCVDELRVRLRDQVLPLGSIPAMRDGEQMALMGAKLIEDARTGKTGALSQPHDLARTRSRMIRMCQEMTQAEWLLWWDDDVWCHQPHVVLQNMITCALATDSHVVGAVYPAKRLDEEAIIAAVQRGEPHPLRFGYTIGDMRFWRRPDYNPPAPHPWLLPVNGVGFGFTLVSRVAITMMTERYRPEVSFPDRFIGGRTVDLCNEINDSFDSFSEDYSFCIRAANSGFAVHAYIGPEAPMIHDGHYSFEADRKCLFTTKTENPK